MTGSRTACFPCCFKGILSKRGKGTRVSRGAAVHHLLRGTRQDKKQRGAIYYLQQDMNRNPGRFRPNRIIPKRHKVVQTDKENEMSVFVPPTGKVSLRRAHAAVSAELKNSRDAKGSTNRSTHRKHDRHEPTVITEE